MASIVSISPHMNVSEQECCQKTDDGPIDRRTERLVQDIVDKGGPAASVDNDGDKESNGQTGETERTPTEYTSDSTGQEMIV